MDFRDLLGAVDAMCSLKKMAEDTGISYAYLNDLKNGRRKEPGYTKGVVIVDYYNRMIEERTDKITERMICGWQPI